MGFAAALLHLRPDIAAALADIAGFEVARAPGSYFDWLGAVLTRDLFGPYFVDPRRRIVPVPIADHKITFVDGKFWIHVSDIPPVHIKSKRDHRSRFAMKLTPKQGMICDDVPVLNPPFVLMGDKWESAWLEPCYVLPCGLLMQMQDGACMLINVNSRRKVEIGVPYGMYDDFGTVYPNSEEWNLSPYTSEFLRVHIHEEIK